MPAAGDESRRERRGLFGRKKKRGGRDVIDSDHSTTSAATTEQGRRKKKGLGRTIRRLVEGRRKSRRAGDDVSAVEVFDKDDSNYNGPESGMADRVQAQFLSKDNPTIIGQDPYIAAGRFGSIVEGDEDEEEDAADSDKEDVLYGSDDDDDENGSETAGELVGPLEIVLVLVDPKSLRFELLQLEFETPQLSRVSECLEQIKDIVTESALKSLEFHSVLDRNGNSFPAKSSLGKALTCRRRGKDILVGVSKGIDADEAGRLARPILGDAKVMEMVRATFL
jgi:hypothetical protein